MLHGCYVTAAARCAPPGNRPLPAELDNCRPYLVAEIGLLKKVRVVVTLGAIALDAWLRAAEWKGRLKPAERPGFRHAGQATLPDGTVLISSYHPSRQNTNTGKLTRAMWYDIFGRAKKVLSTEY
jgi:uracil-DNA glycosylase family 4